MRNVIDNILQFFGMLYFLAVLISSPILFYVLWEVCFDPRIDKMKGIVIATNISLGLLGGYLILKVWLEEGRSALFSKIRSVAPKGFKPHFELHGCGTTEYIGMTPAENVMVVVDMKTGIARCEAMTFYQGWYIDEGQHYTILTIRFNSFDFPSIKFQIPRKKKDEIIAKLNYAMQF